MANDTYACPYHGISGLPAISEYDAESRGLSPEECCCPKCIEEFRNLPDPDLMEPNERVEELEKYWFGEKAVLTLPFSWIHKRFEALVGRPIWTHEFAVNKEGLIKEARERGCVIEDVVSEEKMTEIINLLPSDKTIIIMNDSEAENG